MLVFASQEQGRTRASLYIDPRDSRVTWFTLSTTTTKTTATKVHAHLLSSRAACLRQDCESSVIHCHLVGTGASLCPRLTVVLCLQANPVQCAVVFTLWQHKICISAKKVPAWNERVCSQSEYFLYFQVEVEAVWMKFSNGGLARLDVYFSNKINLFI